MSTSTSYSTITDRGSSRSRSMPKYVPKHYPPPKLSSDAAHLYKSDGPVGQSEMPLPHTNPTIRRRLLLRAFGIVDSHRRGYIASKVSVCK